MKEITLKVEHSIEKPTVIKKGDVIIAHVKSYVRVIPPTCSNCGTFLRMSTWFPQVNNELFCSEPCLSEKYDWLSGYTLKKVTK